MRATVLAVLSLASGCMFVFDGDRESEPDPVPDPCGREPASALRRNPDTLMCDSLDACELDTAASPTWPTCAHACETLDEATCLTAPTCRVAKSALCATGALECEDEESFIGCFPIDTTARAPSVCWGASAAQCASSSQCTAYHYRSGCPRGQCADVFQFCGPEGVDPGACYQPVTCDERPPACGEDETPGVLDGCYTGACIPTIACVWVCAAPPCV